MQGDKTGDQPISESIKLFLKKEFNKPGNVFLGVTHRIDRPTSGIVLFARTSKALPRLNLLFKNREVKKTYYAISKNLPEKMKGTLVNHLRKNPKQNKSYSVGKNVDGSKEAKLHYEIVSSSERYHLWKIQLETGRHHQIRAQLAHIDCPIVGDLKYGFPRSNPDKGICLHAGEMEFIHPVKKEPIAIRSPFPIGKFWKLFSS